MRLGVFLAVTCLALVTLVDAFPQVVSGVPSYAGRSANTDDHMIFTRELTRQGTKLENLEEQQKSLLVLPVQFARMEERMVLYGRMILAVLGCVCTLVAKEVWGGMKSLRNKKSNGDT